MDYQFRKHHNTPLEKLESTNHGCKEARTEEATTHHNLGYYTHKKQQHGTPLERILHTRSQKGCHTVDPFCGGPRERVFFSSLCFFFEIRGAPFLPGNRLHGHGRKHGQPFWWLRSHADGLLRKTETGEIGNKRRAFLQARHLDQWGEKWAFFFRQRKRRSVFFWLGGTSWMIVEESEGRCDCWRFGHRGA